MNEGMETINDLASSIMKEDLNVIAPNFRKGTISEREKTAIIEKVSVDIGVSKSDALAGIMLLMLKGAASNGTPNTLSVDLRGGKTLAKRIVSGAYLLVTGNNYIRRLAESLAIEIGEFAERYSLNGELSQRINTALKAEAGEVLTAKENAWCSSFSQNIPDLASRSSERLVRLLAEDYKKRFDNKKKDVKVTRTATKTRKGGNKK